MDTRAIPRTCDAKEPGYSSVGCSEMHASNQQPLPASLSNMATGFQELEAQQQARLKANEPSARQQQGYVDLRDVVRVRTSLAKGSRQRLILAFYTTIPPLRCDLNRVALLQCPASAATISQDDVNAVKENIFLCLPADKKKPAIFVLRELKIANSAGIWRRTNESNPRVVDISAG